MGLDQKIGVFTTTMRSEFLNAFEATAEPALHEKYTQTIPSTARIEHYTWMSPTPGMDRYKGHRRYGKIESIRYSIENLEFDSSFEVLNRDIKDDQVGGYMLLPKQLAERAKKFPSRWVLKHLAAGTTRTCFDGTAFFANSHDIGTGDNLMTGTGSANADGLSYKFAVLIHSGALKPLIYQTRLNPDLENDAGSKESLRNKKTRYWIDMEGEAAYGYWWDALHFTFTNLPTLTEIQTQLGNIETQFRTFTLPKSLNSEDGEYIHEQMVFDQANVTIVTCTALSNLFRQVLNQDTIVQSGAAVTNVYKGWGNYVPTAFFN